MTKQKEDFLDEIDLRQYIRIISKRWKLIIGITILTAIIAIVINLLTPKEYEATATIMLDTITSISKEESLQTIKLLQIPDSHYKSSSLKILSEDIPSTNLIKLKTLHPDSKIALDACDYIVKTFISERKNSYNKGINLLNKRIQDLNTRGGEINKEIESLRKKILLPPNEINQDIKEKKESNKPEINSILTALIEYEKIYSALDNEMFSLITKKINSCETKLIGPIILQNDSFKANFTKRFLTYVLSGLLLSICLVFFIESCKINKSN